MNTDNTIVDLIDVILHPDSSVGKAFHLEEEMGFPDSPMGKELEEMVNGLTGGCSDSISIDGTVLYADDDYAVVKVSTCFGEYDVYTFNYDETKTRFPDFEDINRTRGDRYLWISFDTGYFVPSDPVMFEEEDSEALAELEQKVHKTYETFKKYGVIINLPPDDLILPGNEELSCGINRASHWLEEKDCAILTAWRSNQSRSKNDSDNACLQRSLRDHGFGVIKVRGCYAEVGQEVSSENSFITFNQSMASSKEFFDVVFNLSKQYNQDCFLYKKAGKDSPACLVGTNESWGIMRQEELGPLHINEMSAKEYSRLGSGTLSFKK